LKFEISNYINKMEIQGYENYLIYQDGRVFSKGNKFNKPRFLKYRDDSRGYYEVYLYKDGKPKNKKIHRLIGEHFIPNPHNYPCIDHKDRNRKNNSLDNLRWCSYATNNQNIGLRKDNKLGIKNISKCQNVGYQFQKTVDGKSHVKWFKTLEGAIKYKEEYLRASQ